jgi:hypothetical protein
MNSDEQAVSRVGGKIEEKEAPSQAKGVGASSFWGGTALTLRSKRKVDVQWRLFALVHNIGKIHTFGTIR